MRFKNRQRNSQLPEVNLVPMMDVLMTVLTFFIIISMTLRGQQIANVNLPQVNHGETSDRAETKVDESSTLVVGLDAQGTILLDNQPVEIPQLTQRIQAFLAENPEGMVLLKADRQLNYETVKNLLRTMRTVGGDRVGLAFDQSAKGNEGGRKKDEYSCRQNCEDGMQACHPVAGGYAPHSLSQPS